METKLTEGSIRSARATCAVLSEEASASADNELWSNAVQAMTSLDEVLEELYCEGARPRPVPIPEDAVTPAAGVEIARWAHGRASEQRGE